MKTVKYGSDYYYQTMTEHKPSGDFGMLRNWWLEAFALMAKNEEEEKRTRL